MKKMLQWGFLTYAVFFFFCFFSLIVWNDCCGIVMLLFRGFINISWRSGTTRKNINIKETVRPHSI